VNKPKASASVELTCGNLRAIVRPDVGGSIERFWLAGDDGQFDWLRTSSSSGKQPLEVLDMACFPLVPFSNRVRNGRFRYGDTEVNLPLNFGDHPHAIHGQGWQSDWDVEDSSSTTVLMRYDHVADSWPWNYTARQKFVLDENSLSIELVVNNQSSTPMPLGLGWHPYFPCDADTTTIKTECTEVWDVDEEVMPTSLRPATDLLPQAVETPIAKLGLDNCFTGWKRQVDIRWGNSGHSLKLKANATLDKLVVFAPVGEDFFCAEPVSHATDAFNQAFRGETNTGMIDLPPGGTHKAQMKLSVTTANFFDTT
jgi:aldose 1-epimerase